MARARGVRRVVVAETRRGRAYGAGEDAGKAYHGRRHP